MRNSACSLRWTNENKLLLQDHLAVGIHRSALAPVPAAKTDAHALRLIPKSNLDKALANSN